MTTRYVNMEDKFEIKCKACGSTDVDLDAEDCHECGMIIGATCNACKAKYDYHKFEKEEGEWVEGKWVKK